MAFDTTIEGVTEETQSILDDFFGHYLDPITYRNLIKKIPIEMGISDFKQLTYEHRQFLMNEYQGSKSNSYCIESLFKYLYLIDVLEEKRKFAELYGDREKIRKHFNRLKNEDIKQDKIQKESVATLSFTQIEKLIEYYNEVEPAIDFSSYKKLRMAFAFYTLFFQGISVNGLRHMNMENYSEDTLMIDGRSIIVPEKFRSMFKYAKENGKVGKYQSVNEDMENLGKQVGIEKLMPKDITMTSKKYQFTCPECGEQYFSFGENWKVVNGKIICFSCAKRLIENDVKKNVISELDAKEVELVTTDEKQKIAYYISNYDELKKKLKSPCDFEEWNKYMKLIGDLGEKYVYEREIKKLIEAQRENLAEKVNADIAKDHKKGYDILSYTVTGEKLHIEVKATPGSVDTPFYISKNEWDTASEFKNNGELYEIHRVYNVGKDDIAVRVYTDISSLEREDVLYKVNMDV